ncbi:TetR/AcrR family transcriptional regulator [Cryptosporangium minutisporangium]|uniref:TetR family transcriptional regulator n=1 Tax=Cryptosporangium minutisporangium TaxID=113569 RepID=A0ABP6T420_9ACTN
MPDAWLAEHSATEPLRRLPSQQRSRQRVERILDAAGELVAERGYEATTTSLIARRARVSPGSFYQFFADKRAAVKALSARNLAVFAERLDAAVVEADFTHWYDAVDVAFDIYVDLCRHHPGFRAVRFGDIVDTHLLDPTQDNDSVVAGRVANLLYARFGVLDTPALRLALLTTTKVADALIKFAFSRDPQGDEEVLLQGRRMLRIHLEGYVQLGGAGAETEPVAPGGSVDPAGVGGAAGGAGRR